MAKGSKPGKGEQPADTSPVDATPADDAVAGRVEGDALASPPAALPSLPPRRADAPPLPAPEPKAAVGEPAPPGRVWVRARQQVMHAGGIKLPSDGPFLMAESVALRLATLTAEDGKPGHVELL